jgi:Kinesin-like protein
MHFDLKTYRSSRSHCIYRIKVTHSDGVEGLLNVVDLAGSERFEPKGTTQQQLGQVYLNNVS